MIRGEMLKKKLEVDHQRNQAIFPINNDDTFVIIVNRGKAHRYSLPDYSDLQVKVSGGRVQLVEVTEKHKI